MRRVAVALALGAAACAGPGPRAERVGETVNRLPEGVTRTNFDFGGRLALVGYEVAPGHTARPGDTIDVRFYWRSTERLPDGWRLFTHLVNDRGTIIGNYDEAGPLRAGGASAEGPAAWKPGKIYVDELKVVVPSADNRPVTDRITLVTGVWRRNLRLDVRGGPARDQAAVITHFWTGVAPRGSATTAP